MAQFKGDLDNLTHVSGRSSVSRGELELIVLGHHLLHEVLHHLHVLLVESFLDCIQADDRLLVSN